TPDASALPVDPTTDVPAGYAEDQRGVPGGFEGEKDIFDTWATSSLTPQLAGGWERDPELWGLVAPFDVRPQGQDIIRTWLFSTMLRSALEDGRAPWSDAAISGFIVDPDRKKMSKSKGNVVTPADILAQHGSDAVRYWAASSRLGTDAAFDPQNPTQIKIGRRLAIKVLNAAKFVLSFPVPEGAQVTHALDASMLATLDAVVRDATKALESFDHARALEVTESFFWTFCDDYLELVKERAYNQTDVGQASAALALRTALSALLRLFAPVISFAAEESWSWFNDGSVHTAPWPEPLGIDGDPDVLSAASAALIGIRRAKTEAKASQKTVVTSMTLRADDRTIERLRLAEGDLRAVGRIDRLELLSGWDELVVDSVELAPQEV
ncbi:MAG: class I tRNA ligase family protein, partial [Microbacterium sp.]